LNAALELRDVTKVFRTWDGETFTAVDGVSLTVAPGRLLGILGPNGAGKTTLLRILYAHWPPTSGTVEVLGHDPTKTAKKLKARLGITPQENNLDPDFNVIKNLTVYARYFQIPRDEARRRATELLAFVGLSDKARSDIESLSGGMKRRLVLARSLINRPDLVLLDEPTTGLDPQARHLVWDKVRELRREGKTIILTTHYMDEAELLCDEIVLMDRGKIHERGSPAEMIRKHASKEVLELTLRSGATVSKAEVAALPGFAQARIDVVGGRIYVYADEVEPLQRVAKERLPVEESTVRRGTLEDVFLRLTGRELRE
jgi:lipooligosaccharide transport system ATP-binding protein